IAILAMMRHDMPLGFEHLVAEGMILWRTQQRRCLAERDGGACRENGSRVGKAPENGHAADGDQAIGERRNDVGDDPYPSIGTDNDVKLPALQRRLERFAEMRIRFDPLHLRRDMTVVAPAAVQHGDVIAAIQKSFYEKSAGRSRSSDQQGFHMSSFPKCVSN